MTFVPTPYPTFPTFPQSVTASSMGMYILNILIWFIEIPIVGIADIFEGVLNSISSGASSSASNIASFPGQIFQSSVSDFSAFGIFAPIVAALVWGMAIVILIFFAFKAIQLALAESTDDV